MSEHPGENDRPDQNVRPEVDAAAAQSPATDEPTTRLYPALEFAPQAPTWAPGTDPWSAQQQWTPTPAPVAPAPRKRRRGVLLGLASLAVAGVLGVNALGLGTLAPTSVAPGRPAASAPAATTVPQQTEQPVVGPGGTTTAAEALSRGVVLIESTGPDGTGAGTGMVLTASGQVLTNYHVVEQSTDVKVTIATTGATYDASVVGRDATRDVALLQLKGASGLATVTVDNDPVTVGESVTAVGNSKGAGRLTSATGVVTDTSASITVASESNAAGSESLSDVIATNASAVPGDSGGPMFDAEGEVLGITTAGSQQQSRRGNAVTVASFAVPIRTALAVVEQIRTGEGAGTVVVGGKAYLGITLATSTMVVGDVVAGTPAASAGLMTGDTITALDGTSVTTRAALAAVLAGRKPGDRVTLAWTDAAGTRHTASVVLATSPVN